MAHEKGGRADKLGNRYEDRWVAEQLLNLCRERIQSLVHEPVGEAADDADVLICRTDGVVELHQCKSSNANKDKWSISDLKERGILFRAKKHLDADHTHQYKLVSPLSCQAMVTLIERANNSTDNPRDFYDYQIKAIDNKISDAIEKNFNSFLECNIR